MFVIDVSEHQGYIDWDTVAKSIDGAIIRVGYGSDCASQDDAQAVRNIMACKRLGIPWGAYIYSYAKNADDARSEYAHAKRVIGGETPALGLWFDTEEAGCEAASWDACMAFCEAARADGHYTGVYTFQAWYWTNLVGIESAWPVWGASYGDACTIPGIVAWQYTSDGSIAGIDGRVDCNKWYIEPTSGRWVCDDTGWWYRRADGTWPRSAWEKIDGEWYLFSEDGYMRTGWAYAEGAWYYLGADGAMRTGWVNAGGKWYFLQANGAMATGWVRNGDVWYYTDSDGVMTTGWQLVGGTWYWMGPDGAVAQGTVKAIGDTFYAFDGSGAMQPKALKLEEVSA